MSHLVDTGVSEYAGNIGVRTPLQCTGTNLTVVVSNVRFTYLFGTLLICNCKKWITKSRS